MKTISLRKIFFLFFIFLCLFLGGKVMADESDDLRDLEEKISEYEAKIKEAQGTARTLASTITVLNNQIYLTAAQIQKTETQITQLTAEIESLSIKIEQIDTFLNEIAVILQARIEETYKQSFFPQIQVILLSDNFSDLMSRLKYLKVAQKRDKELMFQMEEAKIEFNNQKELKEQKQNELEEMKKVLERQNLTLASQKAAKQDLLTQTQNDEAKFQQLLAQARAEYEQIQAILAGRGDEEEVGEVEKGDKIASVIVGNSCNSSGTHLHFTVAKKGNSLNPFPYLKSIDFENCSGPGSCSGADPFNPSGSWPWPLSAKIRMNQGYGETWAIKNTWVGQIYSFHNGIDIIGGSNSVKAVEDGTLFRGSYGGSAGCRLRYVRLDHEDSDLETFYLHVNY